MSETPTPRTDAEEIPARNYPDHNDQCTVVASEFSRQLERELNEAQQENERLRQVEEWLKRDSLVASLQSQLTAAQAERDREFNRCVAIELAVTDGTIGLMAQRDEALRKLETYRELCNRYKKDRDQHKADAERLARALREGLNHGYGLRIGDNALASHDLLVKQAKG